MLVHPNSLSNAEYEMFLWYCKEFFIASNKLWRKNYKGEHKLVISQDKHIFILVSVHNKTGHHSYFATKELIMLRYWWPYMNNNIMWFVKTCWIC